MSTTTTPAQASFDIEWVRQQFPSFQRKIHGQPAAFLDGPGGTQVPQRVIDAISDYLVRCNANTHGQYATSRESDQLILEAHQAMADFLNCDADEVAFGPNMTTLTLALSRAIGRTLKPGDEIVVTRLDHSANVSPWVALEELGVKIQRVDLNVEDCTLNMADLKSKLNQRTRVVAVGYASNGVGTVNPVAEITRLAHQVGALVFIDAVHYAPHGLIDVRAIGCDFLACSPYKFFGPHSGVLYGKREKFKALKPYKVRPASNDLPDAWETGTQNHECMAGVLAAVDYIADIGRRMGFHFAKDASSGVPTLKRRQALEVAYAEIHRYERSLTEKLIRGLLAIPGITVYGVRDPKQFDQRVGTVSMRMKDRTPQQIATRLGGKGLFTWDGNFYALDLTERLGVEEQGGLLRIGVLHYNTEAEVDRLLGELRSM
ncbi:MAG: cysteine desulfurase-like protein [Proteobacteria bacterium]|nr:MAG: cysteine desulfurase-like protein [Pseudomonadota bacterium]